MMEPPQSVSSITNKNKIYDTYDSSRKDEDLPPSKLDNILLKDIVDTTTTTDAHTNNIISSDDQNEKVKVHGTNELSSGSNDDHLLFHRTIKMIFEDDDDDDEIEHGRNNSQKNSSTSSSSSSPPPFLELERSELISTNMETSTSTSNINDSTPMTTTIFLNSGDSNDFSHQEDLDDDDDDEQEVDEDGLLLNTMMNTATTTPVTTMTNSKFHDPQMMDHEEMSSNPSSDDKKRLRLEDFMRQIITQINTSSEKIWPNLLLDFTKNFSELNIPTYVLQLQADNLPNITHADHDSSQSSNNVLNPNRLVSNSDQDLLMDILNIAISSLAMPQTDRRVFACQLLLNIHDCLTMDTIESKVMPLLNDLVQNEQTTSVRFTVCFVLANYARRVEFDYFQTTIFPLFQKLSLIALENPQKIPIEHLSSDQNSQQFSLCTSTTICFALLDSLTSLLSYLLHFNQILMKKQKLHHHQHQNFNDPEDEDMLCNVNGEENVDFFVDDQEVDIEDPQFNVQKNINEVFEFVHQKFLPLLKQIFQRMLDYIDQYRSMSIKIEQDLFNCFLHWRDQIGTHDSISQTLFSHYQSLILFVLILRDYIHKNCENLVDPVLVDLLDRDHWYLEYYYRLCAFHYVLPPSPPFKMARNQTNASQTSESSILIDQSTHSILTKINLMDLGKNNGNLNNSEAVSTSTTPATNQNFIGRYQVTSGDSNNQSLGVKPPISLISSQQQTPSILQQHLQQQTNSTTTTSLTMSTTDLSSATNVTIQNNDFSIGSTQYTFSSNALNNLDIFGFFRYKTIACKITLVSLVPAISDLYYITKNSNFLLAQQQENSKNQVSQRGTGRLRKSVRLQQQQSRLPQSRITIHKKENKKPAPEDSRQEKKEEISDHSPKSTVQEESESSLHQQTNIQISPSIVVEQQQDKEQIISRLIDILNTLSIDNNYEISIKMANIIEKLVERFTEPIRLYSLLTNVLQSQNFDVINQIIRNFFNVFSSMLSSSKNNDETKTIIEYVIETFMRSESYLSTKPKWRLHIQYFDVMFRLARIIPVDVIKRLIMPRLLLRFSTTRPIPCRQAVARCLLLIYLENFAQHDFEKFCSIGTSQTGQTSSLLQCCDHSIDSTMSAEWRLAYLSFDLFNWLDRNLKQSQKYQDRQIYIDIISILIRFLFRDSIEWHQPFPNHFLVDLQDYCPCLMDSKHLLFRFSQLSRRNLKDLHSSQLFAMLLIQRYRLLHLMTEMSTKDRVNTIRASACTVLYSLLQCTNFWVVNNLHRLSGENYVEKSMEDDHLVETIMDYYDSYMENSNVEDSNLKSNSNISSNGGTSFTSEQLYRRLQSESDVIVLEELNKVFLLADDFRLEFNLNYYQLRNKRKKPRKQEQENFVSEVISRTPTCISIDLNVVELVNELLMFVENMNMEHNGVLNEDDPNAHNLDNEELDEGIDLQVDSGVVQEDLTLVLKPQFGENAQSNSVVLTPSDTLTSRRGLIFISNSDLLESKKCLDTKPDAYDISPPPLPRDSIIVPVPVPESESNKGVVTQGSPKKRKSPKHHSNSNNHHHHSNQNNQNNQKMSLNKNLISKISPTPTKIIHHHQQQQNKNNIGQGSSSILTDSCSAIAAAHTYRLQQQPLTVAASNHSKKLPNPKGFKGSHHPINTNSNNKIGNTASVNHHTHHHMSGLNGYRQNKSLVPQQQQRTIALLPTPSRPLNSLNSHHHHHHSSKVPVYNQNKITIPGPIVIPATTNLTGNPNTATAAYPGLCFRIVYPPPPPSSTAQTQFYPGSGAAMTPPSLPPVLTSQQSNFVQANSATAACPGGYHHHYHQHHGQHGPNFVSSHHQSKLPKTTTTTGISHRPILSSSAALPLPSTTATTNKSKWTLHNSSSHLYHRSMSVPPTTPKSHLYPQQQQQQQQQQTKNKNKKLFKALNNTTSLISSSHHSFSSSNLRHHSNIINNNNNHNHNSSSSSSNNNFIRVKKFKNRKTENLITLTSTSSTTGRNVAKNLNLTNNNNDSMETDDNATVSTTIGEEPDSLSLTNTSPSVDSAPAAIDDNGN